MLVTRPQPGASATAERLRKMGYAALVAPATVIEMLPASLPPADRIQALLLTSAAAVQALSANYHHLPLFAVGDATAAAARAAGFVKVVSAARNAAGGDAAGLVTLVRTRLRPEAGTLLFPGAARLAVDILPALRAQGFRVLRRIVYRSIAAPSLSAEAQAALAAGRVSHALFFSPASARALVAQIMSERQEVLLHCTQIEALAISGATAAALAPLQWRRIRVASRPNQDEVLALLP